jgi:glycosyltransferase involved in cell wall biosynthesis
MRPQKKIAFIKVGSFSHANESVLQVLAHEFPEFQIGEIDVRRDLGVGRANILNVVCCVREYGQEILQHRKKARDCLTRTTCYFRQIKDTVACRLAKEGYSFTFQTQSVFDGSIPGTPHFVYTDHTHLANLSYPGFDRRDLYSSAWIELEKQIYHNATLNFTMSSNISRSIVEQYACDPGKVICAYAGANIQRPRDASQSHPDYARKHILFVGVNWVRKGGPQLVQAFQKVLKAHPDAQLTIVGCSPELDIPNCHVMGRLPPSEVGKYYQRASVFCFPTLLEPFGIAVAEALAWKLPIVATHIGAMPELVLDGENGYLVPPGDSEQLADRLIELLAHPDRCRDYGQKSYALSEAKYNWQHTGMIMRKAIRPLIQEG